LLLIDEEAALKAIPGMLPKDDTIRQEALDVIKHVLSASGPVDGEVAARLHRITRLFQSDDIAAGAENVMPLAPLHLEAQSKAS